jgi:hypothetical protein
MKGNFAFEYYKFYVNTQAEAITTATFLQTGSEDIYKHSSNIFTITFDTVNALPDDWSFEVTFTNIKLQEDY